MPMTADETRDKVRKLSAEYAQLAQQASAARARFDEARDAAFADPTNKAASDAAFERDREAGELAEKAASVAQLRETFLRDLTGEDVGASPGDDVGSGPSWGETLLKGLRADAAARAIGSSDYQSMLARGAFNQVGRKTVEGVLIPRAGVQRLEDGQTYNPSREALFGAIRSGDALGLPERQATLLTGAGNTGAGILVQPQRLPGITIPLRTRPLRMVDLITVGRTDSDEISYVAWNGMTNNAAETAEATAATGTSGTKPESGLDFTEATTTVRTIAHWIPATKRALSDAGQLRTLIEQILRLGLDMRLDTQLATGNGTGENLRGIYNTVGIGAITRRGAGTTGNALVGTAMVENALDVIHRAITTVRLAFFEPNAIGINPADFEAIRLIRGTQGTANTGTTAGTAGSGDYIMGDPLQGDGGLTIWGLRPVVSAAFTAGLPVVGDWTQMVMWLREGTQVLASDSHNDFFVRNMVAILAEFRAAVGVLAPAAFCTAALA